MTAVSGGDILWNGSTIAPQGSATAVNLGNLLDEPFSGGVLGSVSSLPKSVLDSARVRASSAAIPASALAARDVFAVFTNGGNTAGVLVTTNSGGSLTLQFFNFGASASAPAITSVLSNSSSIPAGLPNSGIAPSSLFKIVGTGLADPGDASLHTSEGAGLRTSLNRASVAVTVGATTVYPALYYATPTQIDAVLPAATPLGSGMVTVSYNGVISAAAPILVVASAVGFNEYNGNFGVATDLTGTLLTHTNSGFPGETIIIWATGLGADPADSDTTYTLTPHAINTAQVYFGGVHVTPIYQGASTYPGVDVIILTIPQPVLTGCYVPLAAVTGNVVSNIVTLPIHAGGGTCSDPQLGISGDQISMVGGQTTLKTGTVSVLQMIAGGPPFVTANRAFGQFLQSAVPTGLGGGISISGCSLTPIIPISVPPTPSMGLDAGTITVTGPDGSAVTLTTFPGSGTYNADLSSVPSAGGAYVFSASGGAQVGAFTATVSLPNPPLVWTNPDAAATITRSQGLSVTWSGGKPGSFVIVSGNTAGMGGSVTATFACFAPQAAGQFTVPPYILLGLPAGMGGVSIQNSNATQFSTTGLDHATAVGGQLFQVNSIYN
jgi:uncharacterized protein (TIGR03437 family)